MMSYENVLQTIFYQHINCLGHTTIIEEPNLFVKKFHSNSTINTSFFEKMICPHRFKKFDVPKGIPLQKSNFLKS